MNLLLTGATGFVGSALLTHWSQTSDHRVVAAVRSDNAQLAAECTTAVVGDLAADTDWRAALTAIDAVVHCAARVPQAGDRTKQAQAASQRINVAATLNLARQAAAAGAKRFIFISSIKVNGEITAPGKPFAATDTPAPADAYGRSKYEAEQGLRKIAATTGMAVVIIRPPLVYGPGVKANFRRLLAWVDRGIPLPLATVANQRSYVALDNLVALITTCLTHPAAANETFLVSDNADLATPELLRRMGQALGRSARLLPVPTGLLLPTAAIIGQQATMQRLCANLQLDITHTCQTLGWQPPVTVDEALAHTAQAFRAQSAGSGHTTLRAAGVIRVFDIGLSLLGLVVGAPLLGALLLAIYFDTGSPLFRQRRVGRNQQPFILVKFRTMAVNTASVATHLANQATITPLGRLLRKTKLDELPQLWNVLKGDMSLVGPRPGLFNQPELTAARQKQGVFAARPGITGLAQINHIDMSTPELLARTDRRMLDGMSVSAYFKYILQTIIGGGSGDTVDG